MLDLYVGYDEQALAESSRDYTTFQSPFGALRLTTLPMGWTNSVPIFHDDITFILQAETLHITIPYIDDVPVQGPAERYILPSGEPETIPENSGIHRFIWEHFQDLNRVVQRMKYSGGTFSGVVFKGLVRSGFFCLFWTDRQPQPVFGCPNSPIEWTRPKKTAKNRLKPSTLHSPTYSGGLQYMSQKVTNLSHNVTFCHIL